tara:strand:- start:5027 stop:5428 length:402 start_codon:yes stop_codon:yes gene_type:complete
MNGSSSSWGIPLILGGILMANVLFLEKAPAGPWNDASFSVGVTGLISISLIYIAWYKWKFETYGIVPWLNLWKDVRGSGLRITASGFLTIAFTWTFAGQISIPPAGGLILNLIGCLMILQGTYALLSVGYLRE